MDKEASLVAVQGEPIEVGVSGCLLFASLGWG
jgi:hypothetical protein